MTHEKYPSDKVLLAYCGGGGVGGFIFGSVWGAIIYFSDSDSNIIMALLGIGLMGLIAMIFGVFVGFIPAIITGIVITLFKLELNTDLDYLKVGFIGFIVTGIYMIYILPFSSYDERLSFMPLAMVGAISAMFIASHVLPRKIDYQQPFNIDNSNNPPN